MRQGAAAITFPFDMYWLSQSATAILWIASLPAATWVLFRLNQPRYRMRPYIVAAVATVLWVVGLLFLAIWDGWDITNLTNPRWDRMALILVGGFAGSWILCRILVSRTAKRFDLKVFD